MKTKRYVCLNKDGAIVAIIFNDKIDICVKGGLISKWELHLWTKENMYIGVINCDNYECEELDR